MSGVLTLYGFGIRITMQTGHLLVEDGIGNERRTDGNAAEIRTKRVRKQKTDRQDAQLLLRLLMKTDFRGSGYRTRRIVICANCSLSARCSVV
jgi:hypothetical protein